jgi:glucose/arabinose dehydrogenase
MDRRQFLGVVGTAALAGCTASAEERGGYSSIERGPSVGLEAVAGGFREPVGFRTAHDDRLVYVADKDGRIYVRDETGVREEPFLDLGDRLAERTSWEQGLLGFELHPDFETNRRCYVRYSSPPRDGTPEGFSHTFVLAEFRAERDLRRADPDSERAVLEIPEPGENHNAGAIAFGPDGYLYVGVGEGDPPAWWSGRGDPGDADDWYWLNAGGNGQDLTANLLGSVLRIDVDDRDDGKEYAIPDDNPLVGREGLDEQYAWGFRNPYRMGFSGGDLYVGDVGAASVEEVNRVEKGGNYGWNVREGDRCYSDQLAVEALAKLPGFEKKYPTCPGETPSGEPLLDPVIAYPHYRDGQSFGRAVVGGYAYENDRVTAVQDQYVFADLMGAGSGLFAATPSEGRPWEIASVNVASGPDVADQSILSLGRDAAGELYVLTTQFAEGTGSVYRLVPADA